MPRSAAARVTIAGTEGETLTVLTPEALAAWRQSVVAQRGTAAQRITEAGFNPGDVSNALDASLARYKAGF